MQRHRHQEFIRFLNAIERTVPAEKNVHVIVDNYATHKHPKVIAWLARHPRGTFHFTPTSASWLNAVEGFFAVLTNVASSEACSVASSTCKLPSTDFVAETNADPEAIRMDRRPVKLLAAVNPRETDVGFNPLALLWHFRLRDICKEHVTVRTSSGWRSCEEVEDRLPDGRHAWLWWRS